MLRLPRPVLLLALSAVTATTLLAGCTSTNNQVAASPSTSVSQGTNAVTLDITIKHGEVNPNGERINVTQGQTIIMNVTSDADDEIHAHDNGDGYELEVKAGVPATGKFVANDTGSFDVESHDLDKIIAILVVH